MKHSHAQFAYSGASRDAVEDRVRRFVPLVRKSAWHIFGGGRDGLDVEDLMQVGMLALTEAAQRHSGPSEEGFAAYAKLRVRGAMFDHIRKLLPDSRTTVRRRTRIAETRERFESLHGRVPDALELARQTGLAISEIEALDGASVHFVPLESSYDDSDGSFADEAPDAFELLSHFEDGERVLAAMDLLSDRLTLVLQLYFVEELNLKEIAGVLDVSVPRVHQIKAQALSKLKSLVSET